MKVRKMFLALAVMAIIGATAGAASANLIVNGSFEDPIRNPNSYGLYDVIPGWAAEVGKIEVQRVNVAGTPAADGFQFVELDSSQSSTIFQSVATVANQQYELSWSFSPRPGTQEPQNKLGIYIDDALVATSGPQTGQSGNQNTWTRYSYVFSASSASTKISFADLGTPSDSYGTYLDDVQMVAIPEPVFLQMGALLSLGAGGVFRLRRRVR